MQATVYRFDPATCSGSVVTDHGVVLPFDAAALRLSGLRHLRPGQRLSVDLDDAKPALRNADGAALAGVNSEQPRGESATGPRIIGLRLGTIGSTLRD